MLNELDKELEARELRFTRYADDCVIAVRSESSAKEWKAGHTRTQWQNSSFINEAYYRK